MNKSKNRKNKLIRVLVVASDPEISTTSYLDDEINTIKNTVQDNELEKYKFKKIITLSRSIFFNAVREYKPDILHFTNHGSPSRYIKMEDSNGWIRRITGTSLMKGIFSTESKIKCILLNNCDVYGQSYRLKAVSEYVIGVHSKADGVDITSLVTQSFYKEISKNNNYENAILKIDSILSDSIGSDNYILSYHGKEIPQISIGFESVEKSLPVK